MAITKVGSTTPTVARVNLATVTPVWAGDMPRTLGNLLIARVGASGASATALTPPAGWVGVGAGDVLQGTALRVRIFYYTSTVLGDQTTPVFTSTGAGTMYACLEEFTPGTIQANSVNEAQAPSGNTLTVNAGAAPASSGGLSITAYMDRGTVDVDASTPGAGWLSGGFNTNSASTHGGGDYKLNPTTGVADSELITVAMPIVSALAAQIVFFAAPTAIAPPSTTLSVVTNVSDFELESGLGHILMEDGNALALEESTAADQTAYLMYGSMTLKLNTFDFALLDPVVVPSLGDSVTMTVPSWFGTIASIGSSDPVDRGGHQVVTVTATNANPALASAGPFNLSDVAGSSYELLKEDGGRILLEDASGAIATEDLAYSYSGLSVKVSQNTDGTTSTAGQCTIRQTGLWPAQTFLLTSANQHYAAQNFSVTNVTVGWDGLQVPYYRIEFGSPIVTMSVWQNTAINDVFPITSTQITDGAVTTPKLAANSVTASKLVANLILATMIRAGAGVQHIEMDPNGLRAYDPSGNLVFNMPDDGTPITISAQIIASVLTVTGNAIFQGAMNELASGAGLQLDSWQSTPLQAPSLSQTLDGVTMPLDATLEPDTTHTVRFGLDYDAAGGAGATKVFYTISQRVSTGATYLLEILASTRAVSRSLLLSPLGTGQQFTVARLGSALYVARLDGNQVFQFVPDNLYVWQVDQATFTLSTSYGPLSGLESSQQVVTLTSNPAGGAFTLFYTNTLGTVIGSDRFAKGHNMTAAIMTTLLKSRTGDSGLTVTGTTDAGPFTITFTTLMNENTLAIGFDGGCAGSVAVTRTGGWGASEINTAICADGTNLYVVGFNETGAAPTIRWNKYDAAMNKVGATVNTGVAPGVNAAAVIDAAAGNFDLGAARIVVLVGAGSGAYSATVQSFTTAGAVQVNEAWSSRSSAVQGGGVTYGDALGDGARFWSYTDSDDLTSATALSKHSLWTWTSASSKYWVAYSWYDAQGTPHETQVGPRGSITMSRRWQLVSTAQAIPGSGGVDAPNAINFYMLPNATDPGLTGLYLQSSQSAVTFTQTNYSQVGLFELEDASGHILLEDGSGSILTEAGITSPASNSFSTVGVASQITSQVGGLLFKGDGTARIQTNVDLPAGVLGYVQVTAAQINITAEADLTSLTLNVTVAAGRRIRITGYCLFTDTVAADQVALSIKEGATYLSDAIQPSVLTNNVELYAQAVIQPSVGAHTYLLRMRRATGTGTVTMQASANNPASLLIEDIGT